jgi:hypothetical protein
LSISAILLLIQVHFYRFSTQTFSLLSATALYIHTYTLRSLAIRIITTRHKSVIAVGDRSTQRRESPAERFAVRTGFGKLCHETSRGRPHDNLAPWEKHEVFLQKTWPLRVNPERFSRLLH